MRQWPVAPCHGGGCHAAGFDKGHQGAPAGSLEWGSTERIAGLRLRKFCRCRYGKGMEGWHEKKTNDQESRQGDCLDLEQSDRSTIIARARRPGFGKSRTRFAWRRSVLAGTSNAGRGIA